MFAGGTFTNAGGVNMDGVAFWDGEEWNRMGTGIGTTHYVNGFVPALDGKVYAHGFFPDIGSATSRNVAAWNEDIQDWESLGEGVTFGPWSVGNVNALHWIATNNIIAVGNFTNISSTGGTPNQLGNVARWNGSEWGRMDPAGDFRMEVHCLAVSPGINPLMPEGELYVGGWFTNHYPLETSEHMHGMARWDEAASTWHPVGWGITGAARRVYTMMFGQDGNLYVGGNFTHALNADGTEVEANRVAMWNGTVWTNLGEGTTGSGFGWDNVYQMTQCNDGYIYAVGDFTNIGFRTAGGPAANGFARWDGTNWYPVGAGLGGEVRAITINTNHNDIYVGGRFWHGLHEDGSVAHTWCVARWNGMNPITASNQHRVRLLAATQSRFRAGAWAAAPTSPMCCWPGCKPPSSASRPHKWWLRRRHPLSR